VWNKIIRGFSFCWCQIFHSMLATPRWRQCRVAHTNRPAHGTIQKREYRGIDRGENGGRVTLTADSCQTPTATSRVTSMENDRVTFNCMRGHATKARTCDEDKRVMARHAPNRGDLAISSVVVCCREAPAGAILSGHSPPTHTHTAVRWARQGGNVRQTRKHGIITSCSNKIQGFLTLGRGNEVLGKPGQQRKPAVKARSRRTGQHCPVP
jgi:hypothetical protein